MIEAERITSAIVLLSETAASLFSSQVFSASTSGLVSV
jgi:hypothetical protein